MLLVGDDHILRGMCVWIKWLQSLLDLTEVIDAVTLHGCVQ